MIKVAIFDFDHTLAEKKKEFPGTDEEFYTEAYKDPILFYHKYYRAPEKMRGLVMALKNSGTEKFVCMSHMPYSINFKAKEFFVRVCYRNNFEMMSTESASAKIKLIDMMAKYVWHVSPEEILLVDDKPETRMLAEKLGCQVMDPAKCDIDELKM